MGNGACINRERSFSPDDAEGGKRFNSMLAALPKLFSETTVAREKLLCTVTASTSFKSIVFACTDTKQRHYEKQLTQEELQAIVSIFKLMFHASRL